MKLGSLFWTEGKFHFPLLNLSVRILANCNNRMCVAAVLSLTLAHPGIFFKDMGKVKTIEEKHGERGTEFEFRAPNWR